MPKSDGLLKDLAITFGAAAALIGLASLLGIYFNLPALASFFTGYRTIAFSAAILWIILGSLLALHTIKPRSRAQGVIITSVCVFIAAIEVSEIPMSIAGGHFFVEAAAVQMGNAMSGSIMLPTSPAASGLIALSAVALLLLVYASRIGENGFYLRNISALAGLCVALAGFVFVMGYAYDSPFLYGTQIIPISMSSALSAGFIGLGLMAAAGRDPIPLVWFTGPSTRARLLRTFIPLTIAIVIVENILQTVSSTVFRIHNALLISFSLLAFCVLVGFIIAGLARRLGVALDHAERDLRLKNDELHAAYQQLSAIEGELRLNYDKLRETEEALRESEEQYRNVVEDQTEFIARFLPDGTHIFVNEAYCRYFNKKREEIIGKNFGPTIPVEDQNAVKEHFASLTKDHPVAEIRHRIVMPDGQLRWQRWSDRAIFNADGNIIEYQSVGRDINEIMKAEQALRESEEKYRHFFQTSGDCVFITSQDGHWIDFNDAAIELFGYLGREELMQVKISQLYANPEDRIKHLSSIGERGFIKEYPVDLRRKDGTVIPTLITTVAVYDANGNVSGFQGTIRDITAQKRAEEALQESKRRLEQIIDFLPDATFAIDDKRRVIAWNRAIEEMTGVSAQEMLGKGDHEYAIPLYGVRRLILVDLVFSPKEEIREKYAFVTIEGDVITGESVLSLLHGKSMIIWAKAVPLYDSKGNIIGAIESIRDITELRLSTDRLAQVNRQLKILSGITRHDIKNQLMGLNAYISLSEEVADIPDKVKEYIAKQKKIAAAIAEQIGFTKDYENLGIQSAVWQNVSEIVGKTVATLALGNINLDLDCPRLEVYADPMLEKVFYNLIDNSLRYGGGNMTAIRLTAKETGEALRIIYEDDGVGISADDKKQLFTKGFGKNTGLGLFISREILKITGITITETGEPGKGVRFEITVPKQAYRFTTPS